MGLERVVTSNKDRVPACSVESKMVGVFVVWVASKVYGSTAQEGQPGGGLPESQRIFAGLLRLLDGAGGGGGRGSYRSRLALTVP